MRCFHGVHVHKIGTVRYQASWVGISACVNQITIVIRACTTHSDCVIYVVVAFVVYVYVCCGCTRLLRAVSPKHWFYTNSGTAPSGLQGHAHNYCNDYIHAIPGGMAVSVLGVANGVPCSPGTNVTRSRPSLVNPTCDPTNPDCDPRTNVTCSGRIPLNPTGSLDSPRCRPRQSQDHCHFLLSQPCQSHVQS